MGDFEKEQARLLALYEEVPTEDDISSGSEVDEEEMEVDNEVEQVIEAEDSFETEGSEPYIVGEREKRISILFRERQVNKVE